MPTVTFTVWSDVLCPWCYVVAARLEALVAESDGALELRWRTHLLRSEARRADPERYRAYSLSWLRPAEAEPSIRLRPWGEADGPPAASSVPAAVALRSVTEGQGSAAAQRYRMALFAAHFDEHLDVSDGATLLDVAARAGCDPDALRLDLDERSAALEAAVRAEHAAGREDGVTAVPAVAVGEHLLIGAMALERYRRVLERSAAEAAG